MEHFPVIPIIFGEVVIEIGPDDYAEKSDGVIEIFAERLYGDQFPSVLPIQILRRLTVHLDKPGMRIGFCDPL